MPLGQRTILIVAALVVGTGVATATGFLGSVPVIGPLTGADSCGPGDTEIAALDGSEVAAGDTVVIQGKLDYTLRAEDAGITGFKLDGATGTAPVYLDQHPGRELNFGDCLRVRGTVVGGQSFEGVDGPVLANATVLNR